ncbi:zingipain-2-like [Phalaenopsis equestris]|uniref:zingipain-2-like n=1 Tax=Phalaenopsis equestris TaxID=78828 RepID=UPI0009E28994|nr:zingipain-2-like [Phalaenopsis equestris]
MISSHLNLIMSMAYIIFIVYLANSRTIDLTMEARYEQWITQHKRVYRSAAEKARRFSIFKANVEYIESANAKPDRKYRLAVNRFADLTNEEFGSTLNAYLERSLRRNYETFRYGNVTDVPDEMDWRRLDAVTPIKSQESCGSCWAFSAVAATEGINKIKTGNLISLSEQELIDCDVNGRDHGCRGGTTNGAFSFIVKNGGITMDTNYPYAAVDGTCDKEKAATYNAAATIRGYESVPSNSELSLMKAAANQPVSVLIDASGMDFAFYSGGVFMGVCGTHLNHAVTVVGYGTDYDGTSYWLVKNSWGKHWGEEGYMRMQRNIEAKEGLCGIAMFPIFPIA